MKPGITVVTLQDYMHRTTERGVIKHMSSRLGDMQPVQYFCVCSKSTLVRACERNSILRKVVLAYGCALCTHSDPVTA